MHFTHAISAIATVAILSAAPAMAQDKPTIRISTGGVGNAYWNTCQSIKSALGGYAEVQCMESEGSVTNLRRLRDGGADVAIVQRDSLAVFQKREGGVSIAQLATVGTEYVHLVCNKASGIDEATDLEGTNAKIMIGKNGSGAAITWDNWVLEDSDYGTVETVYEAPTGSGLLKLVNNTNQCALFVAGLGGKTMLDVDKAAAGSLVLADANDSDFNDSTDPQGNKIYTWAEIPKKTYGNLQAGRWSAVDTVKQDAVLVASTKWIEANPTVLDELATVVLRMKTGN
jgi:uncharacterized protein